MKEKKERQKRLQQRVEDLKDYIRFANEEYNIYLIKGSSATADDVRKVIAKIEYFNKTRYKYLQINRFSYDPFPVYYFEGFKTGYPKQYKQIVKAMKKENIDPVRLVEELPNLNKKLEKLEEQEKQAEKQAKSKDNAKKFLKQKTKELNQASQQEMTV